LFDDGCSVVAVVVFALVIVDVKYACGRQDCTDLSDIARSYDWRFPNFDYFDFLGASRITACKTTFACHCTDIRKQAR